jgi:hypothetical protein
MSKYIKVKDNEHLVKDPVTKAILNIDHKAILRHEQRMKVIEKEKNRDDEINTIKTELSEIKSLLQKLISG